MYGPFYREQLGLTPVTLRLAPGMLVNAEIHIGTRSLPLK